MIITIAKDNYQNLSELVSRESSSQKITFQWTREQPAFKDALFFLRECLDSLILQDRDFQVCNVPLCLMPGYKRYITFARGVFHKPLACRVCNYIKECKGLTQEYFKAYGAVEIKPVGSRTTFTSLEKCMIKVLSKENNISSERVLKLAKGFKICAGCNDGNHVLMTGNKLVKKGLARKVFKNGTYFWSLIRERQEA